MDGCERGVLPGGCFEGGAAIGGIGDSGIQTTVTGESTDRVSKLVEQGALPILMDEGIVVLEDLRTFHQLGLLRTAWQ